MLLPSYDPYLLQLRGRQEGERRVRERRALIDQGIDPGVEFFPLPDVWQGSNRVVLLDESGYPFALRNLAGEDTGLVVSRCSHVITLPDGHIDFGPRLDTVFYPGPISRLVADLNSICALTFGGRMPYRHADVANFGEKVDVRKILELISKNNMWAQIRSLWSSGTLRFGDIVLVDGTLNVVATPETHTADEIDADLYTTGITLVGLSKSFAPKCIDIVALGRQLYPNQAFIFTIPTDRLLDAHSGADENQMILTIGPRGRTLGLPFGIALSTDPTSLEYHGLYISYRHNQPHREAVAADQVIKVYDNLTLTPEFVDDVLIPIGTCLAQYAKGVVSADYPLPAGIVHSHVLFTASDLDQLLTPFLAAMLEGGETLHYLEYDNRQPHDAVDTFLNRIFRRQTR
jgi:hypothetical protein